MRAVPSQRSSSCWRGSRENKSAPFGSLRAPLPPQRRGKRISRHFSLPCASGGGGPRKRWWGRKRKRCTKMAAAPAGAGVPLPVQVQMNKEAARPSVCTHTEPKTLVWTPQERNPNITPAPSTDTCGQCHSTDKREAGGRNRHRASPRTTQTPKHPTASPNAGCGCRQHRIPSCRRHTLRQCPVRTHFLQHQNTLSPPEYMYAFAASCGSAAQWGAPCLCRSS